MAPVNDTLLLIPCVGCAGLVSGLTGFAFALLAAIGLTTTALALPGLLSG